jgi:hypothetical protein
MLLSAVTTRLHRLRRDLVQLVDVALHQRARGLLARRLQLRAELLALWRGVDEAQQAGNELGAIVLDGLVGRWGLLGRRRRGRLFGGRLRWCLLRTRGQHRKRHRA